MGNVKMWISAIRGRHLICNQKGISTKLRHFAQEIIYNIPQIPKTWNEKLNDMPFTNFAQLPQYVVTNPLPQIERLDLHGSMLDCEKNELDFTALHHLPRDTLDRYAPV